MKGSVKFLFLSQNFRSTSLNLGFFRYVSSSVPEKWLWGGGAGVRPCTFKNFKPWQWNLEGWHPQNGTMETPMKNLEPYLIVVRYILGKVTKFGGVGFNMKEL